ncbi:MAG TPA: glycosyltransferase family 4 protein, partial [Armatimonadota bacterium]|nr:glycosyltransferase family 4 protein [Armatimonadota bacterium]
SSRTDSPGVLHLVPEARGGICRHVADLCRRLSEAGWRCRIAGPRGSLTRIADFGSPREITMISLPRWGLRGVSLLTDAVEIRRFVSSSEILHAHGYRAGLTAAFSGIPGVVITAHNLPPRPALPLVRLALNRADAVTAVSTAVADALVNAGVAAGRIRVIPNGIELSPLPSAEERSAARAPLRALLPAFPEGPILLFVGRLSIEKGIDTLIGAFDDLAKSKPDLGLVIVGESPVEVDFQRLVPPRLQGRMVFAGQRKDAPSLMAGADVVVIPSRLEGQSIVALEALACGTRVVASNAGGLPEMIRPGETGWPARPGDSDDLARAIKEALDAPADRFSAAGRTLIAQKFDAASSFRKTLETYEAIGARTEDEGRKMNDEG